MPAGVLGAGGSNPLPALKQPPVWKEEDALLQSQLPLYTHSEKQQETRPVTLGGLASSSQQPDLDPWKALGVPSPEPKGHQMPPAVRPSEAGLQTMCGWGGRSAIAPWKARGHPEAQGSDGCWTSITLKLPSLNCLHLIFT